MIFQPAYPSSGSQVARSFPGSSRHKVGTHPQQDSLPSQGHSHPHSLRLGQMGRTSLLHVHAFGMWKEAAFPRENPQSWGECANSAQTGALARN